MRLTEMQSPALEAMVKEELIAKRTNLLNRCMQSLSQLGSLEDLPRTSEWRAFLEASRDRLVAEIQTPELAPISDASARLGDDGLRTLRAHGQQFAQALRVWPAICETARSFMAE